MKSYGIILAGGAAERLQPVTSHVSKQLLPVYDKPMIYYPLTTLLEGGVRDVTIITNPHNVTAFNEVMQQLALNVHYRVVEQAKPAGIAEALPLFAAARSEALEADAKIALILGDNLFFGKQITRWLRRALSYDEPRAGLLAKRVRNPERYGVLDRFDKPQRILEKPSAPPTDCVVTGLYVYPPDAIEAAAGLAPSARGELEITDVNNFFLDAGRADVEFLTIDQTWFDMGSPDCLLQAAQYVQALQRRVPVLVGSPEIAACRNGWIGRDELALRVSNMPAEYAARLHKFAA